MGIDIKNEDIIAIIILILSFLALYLGKATWEQIFPIITTIIGIYFGVAIGHRRAMRALMKEKTTQ
jgi:uncharacterized protein YacL